MEMGIKSGKTKDIMPEKHSGCLICGSAKLQELKGYEKDHLVKCNVCGFVFCHNIPTQQELIKHYDGYPRNNYNSPITIKRYNELLDSFESYKKTNNILDIGCGDGYFLEAAKKRGWNVYGTEFTDAAITVCSQKGILMHEGILNPDNYNNVEFDVITSFEVIEHINNPQTEIKSIKKILRSGGLFYLTTPNFNSISRTILKGKWNVIEYPEHLSYYTHKTINKLMTSDGFLRLKVETTGINISRIKESKNKGTDKSEGSNTEEELREKTETRFIYKLLKKAINSTLNLLKKGDSLKGWYLKK
jgi:2-polyprenyl-3-methyl-5-hydroxy-6-metoxy-1,4-benzoquinol methylase